MWRYPPLLQSATLGDTWLHQMAAGASAANVSIQYTQADGRHMLASTALPAVTQVLALLSLVPLHRTALPCMALPAVPVQVCASRRDAGTSLVGLPAWSALPWRAVAPARRHGPACIRPRPRPQQGYLLERWSPAWLKVSRPTSGAVGSGECGSRHPEQGTSRSVRRPQLFGRATHHAFGHSRREATTARSVLPLKRTRRVRKQPMRIHSP